MKEKIRFGKYLRALLSAGDFLVLNLAYFLTVCIAASAGDAFAGKWVWLIVNIAFIPAEFMFSDTHTYRMLYIDRVFLNAFKNAVITTCVFVALLYIMDVFNATVWVIALFFGFFYLMLSLWWLLSRLILKKIRRMGFNYRRAVIVGCGKTARMVLDELQSDSGYGYRLMGFFAPDKNDLKDFPGGYHGNISELEDFVRLNRIDLIYYTLDAEKYERIAPVIRLSEEVGAEFLYIPKFNKLLLGQFCPQPVGNLPGMIHTFSPLNKSANRFLKRVVDLAISIPFLIVSPLIFIPIAVGIKLSSPGPVFFKQKRTGIYGSEFMCYKFRTMKVNSQSDTLQATEHDERKTRFGDFLRRSSLDELPQFFNVLIGNMSVVGPRPHMVKHTEEYFHLIDKYMVRHAVKPGITGWAQVNGYRGGTKHLWQMEKRVEFDVWYIRNWNFFLDLKIVFLTVFNGIRGEKNAY